MSGKKSTAYANKIVIPFDNANQKYTVEKVSALPNRPVYLCIKRFCDIAVSVFGILLLCVPMLAVYLIIACTSKGNPIYKQERLGKDGKAFFIYKFRTMYADAEKNGAQWSTGDADTRITPVGAVLRRTKFDEIPQLLNCLKGDLSLVGPRPERKVFYEHFETYVHGFSQRLMVKPGITGLAQVRGGYSLKPEEKIVYDMEYIKNRSLRLDFKILLLTVFAIIRGDDRKHNA